MKKVLYFFSDQNRTNSDDERIIDFIQQMKFKTKAENNQINEKFIRFFKNEENKENLNPFIEDFQFQKNEMVEFLNHQNISDFDLNKMCPFVFSNSFGFLNEKTKDATNVCESEDLLLVLSCLHKICFTRYSKNADHMFLVISESCIEGGYKPFSLEVIGLICAHFNNFHFYPKRALNLLLFLIQKSYSMNYVQTIGPIWLLIQKLYFEGFENNVLCSILLSRLHYFEKEIYETLKIISISNTNDLNISNVKENDLIQKNNLNNISNLYSSLPTIIIEESIKKSIKDEEGKDDIFSHPLEFSFATYEDSNRNMEFISNSIDFNLNNTQMIQFELPKTRLKMDSFIPKEAIPTFHLILKLLDEVPNHFIEVFFRSFQSILIMYPKRIFAHEIVHVIFVYFLSKIHNKVKITHEILESLLNELIFEPSITIFNTEVSPLIHLMRKNVVGIIAIYCPEYIIPFFQHFISQPFLFAEILFRVQNVMNLFQDISILYNEKLFIFFMTVEKEFCSIYNLIKKDKESKEKNIKSLVISARCKLFSFVFSIFQTQSIPISIFENPFFSTSFLSAFFEPVYKEMMFSQLKEVLVSKIKMSSSQRNPAIDFILSSIKIILLSKNENHISLFVQFLNCLSECISLNTSICSKSIDVFSNSIRMTSSSCSFISEDMIVALLKLGIKIISCNSQANSDFFDFDPNEIIQLSLVLKKVELTDNIQSSLMCLFAASGNVQNTSAFLIRRPSIALLLASIYSQNNMITNFFEKVTQFINFSLFNLIQLHEGEIDLLMIEMINYFPNDFKFRKLKFKNFTDKNLLKDVLLPLLIKIISVKSSIVVANGISKLICPHNIGNCKIIEKESIPEKECFKFNDNSINLLNNLISYLSTPDQHSRIFYSLALNQSQIIEEFELKISDILTNGITIAFSLFIDSKIAQAINVNCPIFSVSDQYGIYFGLFIKGNSLFMTQRSEELMTTLLLNDELPSNEFTTMAITIDPFVSNPIHSNPVNPEISRSNKNSIFSNPIKEIAVSNIMKVQFLLNLNYPLSTRLSFDSLEDTSLKLIIGGGIDNILSNENKFSRISNFEKLAAYQMRSISVYHPSLKVKECATLFNSPDFNLPSRKPQIRRHKMENIVMKNSSIFEIFRKEYEIENVFPIFMFLNQISLNHQFLLIDFLKIMFHDQIIKIVDLIPCVISSFDNSFFSYSLYFKFSSFVELVHNEIEMSMIFDSLIFNLELWCKSPQFEEILNYISSNVFNTCTQQFLRPHFLKYTVTFLRLLPTIAALQTQKVDGYRNKVIEIIKKRIMIMIYSHDIDTVLSSLLYCNVENENDKKLVHSILSLIPIVFERTLPNNKQLNILLKFKNLYDPEYFGEILPCFKSLPNIEPFLRYLQFYYPCDSSSVINEVLSNDNNKLINPEILVSEVQNNPKLLDLALLSCIQEGNGLPKGKTNENENFKGDAKTKLAELLYSFANDSKIKSLISSETKFWMFWPLIFASEVDSHLQMHVFYFLSQIIKDQSPNLNDSIDIILDIIDFYEMDELRPLVLKIIVDQYLLMLPDLSSRNDDVISEHINMLVRCFRVLYFSSNSISNILINEFSCSVLNNNMKTSIISSQKKERIISVSSAKQKLENNNNCKLIFRFRIVKDMSSVEKELAILLKRLIKLIPIEIQKILNHISYINIIVSASFSMNEEDNFNDSNKNELFLIIEHLYEEIIENVILHNINEHINITKILLSDFFSVDENILNIELSSSFTSSNLSLSLRKQKKQDLFDPLNSILKLNRRKYVESSISLRRIVRDFMHVRSNWKINDFIWQKNTRTTSKFLSIQMERRFATPKPKFAYSFAKIPNALFECECMRIKLDRSQQCRFFILPKSFVITYPYKVQTFENDQIRHILIKSRFHLMSGIEFYLTNGYSFLFDFSPMKAETVLNKIGSSSKFPKIKLYQQTTSFQDFFDKSGIMKMYKKGELSNFDFLLTSNSIAGRSFNDATIYPIFPALTKDRQFVFQATSEEPLIVLPVDSRSTERLKRRKKSKDLKEEGFFASGPSNCFLVSYYAVRLQPFTYLNMKFNDGHFDVHDRMFNSYKSYLKGRADCAECKEVIPELYSMPEILMKLNPKFYEKIEDLVISKTKYKSIFDFVYKQRRIIEEQFPTNKWFDMIFGVDQHNINIFNVFDKCLYEDAWNEIPTNYGPLLRDKLNVLGLIPPKLTNEKCIIKRDNYCNELTNNYSNIKNDQPKRIKIRFDKKLLKNALFLYDGNSKQFFVICENEEKYIFVYQIDNLGTESTTFSPITKCFNQFPLNFEHSSMEINGNRMCFFDSLNGYLFHIICHEIPNGIIDKKICSEKQQCSVKISVFDGDLVALVLINNCVEIWNENSKKIGNFKIVTAKVVSISMSMEFDIVVIGTNDSFVSIYSISKERYVNSIELVNDFPLKIFVTQNNGLIIIIGHQKIYILTINGFLVNDVKIDKEIDIVCQRNDVSNGKDLIYFSDRSGHIFVFDPIEPDKIKCIAAFGKKVISLSYCAVLKSIVSVTNVGSIIFVNC